MSMEHWLLPHAFKKGQCVPCGVAENGVPADAGDFGLGLNGLATVGLDASKTVLNIVRTYVDDYLIDLGALLFNLDEPAAGAALGTEQPVIELRCVLKFPVECFGVE